LNIDLLTILKIIENDLPLTTPRVPIKYNFYYQDPASKLKMQAYIQIKYVMTYKKKKIYIVVRSIHLSLINV